MYIIPTIWKSYFIYIYEVIFEIKVAITTVKFFLKRSKQSVLMISLELQTTPVCNEEVMWPS